MFQKHGASTTIAAISREKIVFVQKHLHQMKFTIKAIVGYAIAVAMNP